MGAAAVSPVLDASALLAYLRDEPGADVVADAISVGAALSTVNLAEVLSTVAARGHDPAALVADLTDRGVFDGAVTIEPFTTEDAIQAALLRPLTSDAGLSLGDRACIALARRLDSPALTADSAWAGLSLGPELRLIR